MCFDRKLTKGNESRAVLNVRMYDRLKVKKKVIFSKRECNFVAKWR